MPFIWKVRVLFKTLLCKTRLIFPRINGPIVKAGVMQNARWEEEFCILNLLTKGPVLVSPDND